MAMDTYTNTYTYTSSKNRSNKSINIIYGWGILGKTKLLLFVLSYENMNSRKGKILMLLYISTKPFSSKLFFHNHETHTSSLIIL